MTKDTAIQAHHPVSNISFLNSAKDTSIQAHHSLLNISSPNPTNQLVKLDKTLGKGKLPLTKWATNCPEVLKYIDESHRISSYVEVDKADKDLKILGLHYSPIDDCFLYSIKPILNVRYTKRRMLSIAASIFDPIGWLLPVVMKLRIEIQHLWQEGYDWDDIIQEPFRKQLENVFSSLEYLNEIRVPRWSGHTSKDEKMELVGFSDASGDGYAAVIYSRRKIETGCLVRLIAARGRVTPLKTRSSISSKACTIPKLELESVVLLTELFNDVRKNLGTSPVKFTAYTDSEVALCWIRSRKDIENKLVKRRVAAIHKYLSPTDIHHVRSSHNPADCASRGMCPRKFVAHKLWFHGPQFLQGELPRTEVVGSGAETVTHLAEVASEPTPDPDFIQRFSSLPRLINTIARCRRWRSGTSVNSSKVDLKIMLSTYKDTKKTWNEQLNC
ncbi:uncharacterized protein LOC119658198 [Hermetia illucens]|uniref:uncharacterized protein LOC119658198 n=1 Tax=Hermetia illucens TaxID=343691 RepID=UPI0018CC083D|nr:uncharacterized protein LOC119658198 [Hermetia illucens]